MDRMSTARPIKEWVLIAAPFQELGEEVDRESQSEGQDNQDGD